MVPSAARGGSTRANQRVALYGDTPGAEGSLIAAVRARHAATAVRRFEEMRHGWFSRGDASASPGAMPRAHKAEARAREAVALLLRCPVRSILTAVLRFAYK